MPSQNEHRTTPAQVIHLAVIGAMGRMGQAISMGLAPWHGIRLVGAIESPHSPLLGKRYADALRLEGTEPPDLREVRLSSSLETVMKVADVIVDFSSPASTSHYLRLAASTGRLSYIIGTTGFSAKEMESIHHLAKSMPIFKADNFSLGVYFLNEACRYLAEHFKAANIEIVERHHRYKKDAPSGTAKALVRTCADARHLKAADVMTSNRSERMSPRTDAEIGVHSLRAGDVVGEHSVSFRDQYEEVILSHVALSRKAFTRTLETIIPWIHMQKAERLYGMRDVFSNLKTKWLS